MKMIVQSEADVRFLQGKFILQINSDNGDWSLTEKNWSFVKEKRLGLVIGYKVVGLYGNEHDTKDFDGFKNYFNEYLFPHTIAQGKTTGGRYHRLLTNAEIDFLASKLKSENY